MKKNKNKKNVYVQRFNRRYRVIKTISKAVLAFIACMLILGIFGIFTQ